MGELTPLPYGLPHDPEEYRERVDKARVRVRRKYPRARATEAVLDAIVKGWRLQRKGVEVPARWFFAVVKNLVFDQFRRDKIAGKHLDGLVAAARAGVARGGHSQPEEHVMAEETRERVDRILADLTPKQRAVWDRSASGESCDEIARSLAKKPAAVRMTVHRIRLKLLAALPAATLPAPDHPQ